MSTNTPKETVESLDAKIATLSRQIGALHGRRVKLLKSRAEQAFRFRAGDVIEWGRYGRQGVIGALQMLRGEVAWRVLYEPGGGCRATHVLVTTAMKPRKIVQ